MTLILILEAGSIISAAQTINRNSAKASIPFSDKIDRDANAVVFESETITVRRITIAPNSTGYHYRHPGGSIILVREYSFKLPIPLSGELDAELKVGDVIRVPAGDYVLENPRRSLWTF